MSSGPPVDPRLLRRGRATRGYLAATVLVGAVQAGLVVTQAWLLATVVTDLVDHSGLAGTADRLTLLAVVLAGRAATAWLQQWLGHRASAQVKSELRLDVLAARLRRPRATTGSSGRLMTLVGEGLDALDGWYARYLPALVLGVVVPVVVGIAIATADLVAAITVALTVPLIPLFMVLVGLATRHRLDKRWRAQAVLAHRFADLVAGLTTLQGFGRARSQVTGLRRTEERHRAETMGTLRVAFLSALVLELLATLSVAVVAVGVGLRVVDDQLALGTALFVLLLAPEAYLPLRQVGTHYHDAADGMAAADEALTMIDSAPPVTDEVAELPPVQLITLTGVTAVDRPHRTDPLSCTIRAGRVTAITGPSGSGKTTALELIMGLLTAGAGTISLDETPLTPATAAAWRRQVAWVPQTPGMITGTVADNVRLGHPPADDDAVREVLDRCGAGDLELGRHVGGDGGGLSVGERRRVALARARLRITAGGARWLLLDEPTAGLDVATEQAVVRGLPPGVGVIAVTHRAGFTDIAEDVIRVAAPARRDELPLDRPEGRQAKPEGRQAEPEGRQAFGAAWLARLGERTRFVGAIVLGVLAASSGAALLATAAWLLTRAAEHPPVLHLMVAVVAVRFFGIGKGVFRYVERLAGHDVGLRQQSRLRISTYARLADQLLLGREQHRLVNRLTRDVGAVVDRTVRATLPQVVAVVVVVAAIAFAAVVHPGVALALVVGVVVSGLIAPAVGDALARRGQQRLTDQRAVFAGHVGEAHRLAAELTAYGAAPARLARVATADHGLRDIEQRAATAGGVAAALQLVGIGAATLAALVIGGPAVAAGTLSGPVFAVLVFLPLALTEVLGTLPVAALTRTAARTALARVRAVGAGAPPIADPDRLTGEVAPAVGSIELADVTVGWPGAAPVLTGVDLSVGPGGRVALTGPSGLGKTTVAATVIGLLGPPAGQVTVTGRIGYLAQDAHLFDTTVTENVRLGRPDATDAQVSAALARVGLDLDPGRRVGEHGAAISGGEARRVALARLVLRGVDVVVLDEPTEHLDRATAGALLDDVDRLWPDAAILVITHAPELVATRLGARVVDARVWRTGTAVSVPDRKRPVTLQG
ncbi:thiol reductant ABC exporter subunit CydD [Propionibacteriaceae bacterium Y2011]